ncbi:MAG: YhdP family protein [Ketobacteraceae bacterium]|nr:YhdP family protein [Ketobacteraceae bacterium]
MVLLLSRLFLVGLIALVVLAAVVVGVGRQLVSHIEEFQPEIRNYLSDATGLTIRFDSISGDWQALSPQITLESVSVQAPAKPAEFLAMKQLTLEVDLGNSLLKLRPVIKVWLDGAAFEIQYQDKRFSLKNGPDPDSGSDEQAAQKSDRPSLWDRLDLVLRQPYIEISNSRIAVKGFWKQDAIVSDINLGVIRKEQRKHFRADLTLESESRITASVYGDISGRLSELETVNGHLYSRVSAPQLAPWMPLPVSELSGLEISEASGDVELWGKIHQGTLERVTARLRVEDVSIVHEDRAVQPPLLQAVNGVAKWEGNWQGDWVVGFESLEVSGEDFTWHPEQLVLHSSRTEEDKRHYIGRLDQATLSPWVRYYLAFLDGESSTYRTLSALQPDAVLSDLVFEMNMSREAVSDFRMSARLSDISLRPKRWIPGVNNVTANLLIGKSLSVIELRGENVDLDYPRLFRAPLQVDEVKGALVIHNSADELRIESGLLEVNDRQLNAATQLAVIKDKARDADPYLRLQATLDQFDAANVYDHLPVGVIPDGVANWLDTAIKSGTLLRSDLLFHGPVNLEALEPFQFVLGFTVDNTRLSFQEAWRPIDDLSGDVRIYNGVVDAWAFSGSYYDADLDQAWVGTRRIAPGEVDLIVDAGLTGPLEKTSRILVDSPISEVTAPVMETMSVSGTGNIKVRVEVPFRQGQEPDVEVQVGVTIEDGIYRLKEPQLTIEDVAGEVKFSMSRGLSASGLTGKLFGGDIRADITTEAEGDTKQTRVLVNGNTDFAAIKPWLKLDLLAPISGPFGYQADIVIHQREAGASETQNTLKITSDLTDVTIAYPYPLNKPAGNPVAFRYQTTLGAGERLQTLRFDHLFELRMVTENDEMERGAIMFGGDAVLPDSPYFAIGGTIDHIDADAWLNAWKPVQSARQSSQQGKRSAGLVAMVDHSTLKIGSLALRDLRFRSLELAWLRQDGAVSFQVDSPDIRGDATIPHGYLGNRNYRELDTPLKISISQLRLPKKTASEEAEQSETPLDLIDSSVDPRVLPALDLEIASLQFGDDDFGRWRLNWSPVSDGVHFDSLAFELKALTFAGTGDWLWKNERPETRIAGEASASNVADILTAWGYAPSLTSETARMKLSAQWRNAPYDFDLLTAEARLDLIIKEGRFLNVSSGAADKVLGVLNFDDWLSRLRLKIKDLESNEMPYSEIRGDFLLKEEILNTKQLKLDGAAMKMTMDGDLNLESKTIDANLSVVIPVTRNLVIPAAAMGGLPAAATVYVIEKVLGSQLDKLTTMKYKVDGPLNDPSVTLQESFNIIPKQIQESIVKEGGASPEAAPSTQESETPEDSTMTHNPKL